jgi:hypothetical protein
MIKSPTVQKAITVHSTMQEMVTRRIKARSAAAAERLRLARALYAHSLKQHVPEYVISDFLDDPLPLSPPRRAHDACIMERAGKLVDVDVKDGLRRAWLMRNLVAWATPEEGGCSGGEGRQRGKCVQTVVNVVFENGLGAGTSKLLLAHKTSSRDCPVLTPTCDAVELGHRCTDASAWLKDRPSGALSQVFMQGLQPL